MALISLEHVSKVYPKGTRPALDDISLNIERGNFVFLVGASGSGKTTLLSLLLREEDATEGEIRVAGNDLRRITNRQVPQYRRSIGFIFQDYKLLNNKTVWQNVAFALEVIGTSRSTIKSLVPKVLNTVGLTGKENNYPHELSGGEAQRVAIARAYVNHPQILLADEPTGNLDPTTSLGIMEVLDAINRTGTTIVMATHNEEIVNSMRKRVVELHSGKIVRDERQGSYDSALFFPDSEVESKAQQGGLVGTAHAIESGEISSETFDERESITVHAVDEVAEVLRSGGEENEGIARLASAVHSGRTGRYGEAFQSAEATMTWGKGIHVGQTQDSDKSTLDNNSVDSDSIDNNSVDGDSLDSAAIDGNTVEERSSENTEVTAIGDSTGAFTEASGEVFTTESSQQGDGEYNSESTGDSVGNDNAESHEKPSGTSKVDVVGESHQQESDTHHAENASQSQFPPAPPQPPVPPTKKPDFSTSAQSAENESLVSESGQPDPKHDGEQSEQERHGEEREGTQL